MKKNIFIVVDGLDGSGKSEIVKMLHNYLFSKHKKFRIMTTREPTNGIFGRKIREMLVNESDPLQSRDELTDLFVKDRKEHIDTAIRPFLESGGEASNIVICDRYYYSTIAFQGAQGIDINLLLENNKDFLKPDIAFILDVDPNIALKRIEYRKKEKFEQNEFMQKIRQNFLKLPEMLEDNITLVNSNKPISEVFNQIKKEVEKIIN